MYKVDYSDEAEKRLLELYAIADNPELDSGVSAGFSEFGIAGSQDVVGLLKICEVFLHIAPYETSQVYEGSVDEMVRPLRWICYSGFYVYVDIDDEAEQCMIQEVAPHPAQERNGGWGGNTAEIHIESVETVTGS